MIIDIKNWSVIHTDGTKAITNMNLQIEAGEKVALVGANGAGKSSLITSLVGIVDGVGTCLIAGIELKKEKLDEIRTKIGVVFQNPDDQLFMPTIYDDIAFGPRNLGVDEETIKHRVEDRLRLLEIEHLKDKTALRLSGGEKRMAAMATVLSMKPEIMVLDEPTAFLDPKARRKLIRILKDLPHTMIIATHDLSFAAELCSRTVLLKQGEIFADGKSEAILQDDELMEAADVESIAKYLNYK